MKTLVIHPNDYTTLPLSKIYKGKGFHEITHSNPSSGYIRCSIKDADRIIMLGHGTEDGLLYGNKKGFVISSKHAQLLRQKECIMIWCFAKQFATKYKLKGFGTDMFISELEEAIYCSVYSTLEEIEDSFHLFSNLVSEQVDKSSQEIFDYVNQNYGTETNVKNFNQSGFFIFK